MVGVQGRGEFHCWVADRLGSFEMASCKQTDRLRECVEVRKTMLLVSWRDADVLYETRRTDACTEQMSFSRCAVDDAGFDERQLLANSGSGNGNGSGS